MHPGGKGVENSVPFGGALTNLGGGNPRVEGHRKKNQARLVVSPRTHEAKGEQHAKNS